MNILFGRRRTEKVFVKPPEIRESFAQEVLDLEVEVNFNCTIENIKALMELYTHAIEHYESEKNKKYLHYQSCLQKLLSRPEVLLALNAPVQEKPAQTAPNLPVERSCEKALQNHRSESQIFSQQIIESLKTQSDNLQTRLELRKKNRINIIRQRRSLEIKQCDISAGNIRLSPIEIFEEEVEKIMEKFVVEKTEIKKEIEEKYGEYVREIQEMEGEIMKKLVGQLEKTMKEELDERMKELEDKRNAEIAFARKRLLNKC